MYRFVCGQCKALETGRKRLGNIGSWSAPRSSKRSKSGPWARISVISELGNTIPIDNERKGRIALISGSSSNIDVAPNGEFAPNDKVVSFLQLLRTAFVQSRWPNDPKWIVWTVYDENLTHFLTNLGVITAFFCLLFLRSMVVQRCGCWARKVFHSLRTRRQELMMVSLPDCQLTLCLHSVVEV